MGAAPGDQRREILEQHHPVRDRVPSLPRRRRVAERAAEAWRDRAGAGRLALERQVVQDGEAVVGMQDEVDLDAGPERHALEDAPAGEDRIGGAAAGAVPLEEGAVAVAGHRDRVGHLRSAAAVDRDVVAVERRRRGG